jgi:hypothetical protein
MSTQKILDAAYDAEYSVRIEQRRNGRVAILARVMGDCPYDQSTDTLPVSHQRAEELLGYVRFVAAPTQVRLYNALVS